MQQFKSFTGEEMPDVPTSDNDPLGALSQLKVSVTAVEEEDGTLAHSLYEMIEDKTWANDLIIEAKRSGLKMLELLRAFADTADESDTALAPAILVPPRRPSLFVCHSLTYSLSRRLSV